MPTTSGPFSPTANVPIVVNNPAQGSGNAPSSAAVIVNLSPFELVVSSGSGAVVGLVDPFTRNIIPLDEAGQQLTMDPLPVGLSNLGVTNTIYVQWYGASESPPGSYPSAIGGVPVNVTLGEASLVANTGPNDVAHGATITPFTNLTPGIYRSARVYLSASPTNPTAAIWANVNLFAQFPGGGTNPTYELEDFNVLLPAYGLPAAAIVLPIPPFGANGVLGVSLAIQNLDATNLLRAFVVLDPAPVEKRSVPFPIYQGGEVPKVATAATGFVSAASGASCLAAPPANVAYYIFGIDVLPPAADSQSFTGTGFDAGVFSSAANQIFSTSPLGGQRVTSGLIYHASNVAQAVLVNVRYSYGP